MRYLYYITFLLKHVVLFIRRSIVPIFSTVTSLKISSRLTLQLIILLSASSVFSQETKEEQKIEKADFGEAENFYRRGRIDEAIGVLKFWLGNKKNMARTNNKTIRANIYHLASQCYILDDKPDTAQMYIEKMLKIWPDYKERRLKTSDLDRFVIAIDTLYTLPRFQIGFRMGMNYSFINTIKEYPVLLQSNETSIERSSKINFQVGLIGEYEFWKYTSISLEPSYTRLTHRLEKDYVFTDSEEDGEDEIRFDEELEYWEMNYLANFKFFPRSKTRLILSAGGTVGILTGARKEIDRSNAPLTTTNSMESLSYGIVGRIGGTRRFYSFALGANISYTHYLNLANDPNNRYVNDPQATSFTYGYYSVPDDFRLSNLQLNFSIHYFIDYKVYH